MTEDKSEVVDSVFVRYAKWGKGGKYVVKLKNGSSLVIHCKPQVYKDIAHLLYTKFNISKRIYKVWCSVQGSTSYKLNSLFMHPRYVTVDAHFLVKRKSSLKRAVSIYLDVIYHEVMVERITRW